MFGFSLQKQFCQWIMILTFVFILFLSIGLALEDVSQYFQLQIKHALLGCVW